ncbi:MAG: hypothetical protein ACUVTD_09235 [Nitrososphaerales archaeon]
MTTKLKVSLSESESLQKRLEEELDRLKRKLGMGYELKVVWMPNNNSNLAGEVKGETIFIYEEDLERALETLRHEFLDYAISQVIEPYRQVANSLILILNRKAYERKERLVEKLAKWI